ncbi:AAA family ATPase, partial [Candidatus Uhrbacteria bacterium]|nr:AAA family ATPase [Candidatus Uhrbacteria bacterium]
PDVWNALLQILEEGRLTDAKGRKVNFKNAVIIMTSNVGSETILDAGKGRAAIGFDSGEEGANESLRELVRVALQERFKPEFLNRLDETIIFNPLSEAGLAKIVEIQLAAVVERLAKKHLRLSVSYAAKVELAKKGFDPVFGARPLKRAIQHEILDPLALMLVRGEVGEDDAVQVDAKDGVLSFSKIKEKEVATV